ncbi:MAG: hypothetical protein RXN89_02465 [Vulcanisaeta sp.]|jgi:hypothetical protein|nr:MAG: hypothetical protein AT718_07620 [Vulcanisaeta sp. JCHS_4]KUO87093.1 MAG: hypothetical protein AT716_04510 [Vulcanisaeta sp. MG_3]MCG2864989.1 hypothetical protein [Vulcanisaeta sp.]PVU72356.1 hypothetical protein DDW08_02080 [Vulcanisaeta sp. SCGC AB-777_J10]MCG2866324.1 hypothetical protein [Vulcanisaeta sp.]
MLSEIIRFGLVSEIRLSIPNVDDALDYLRLMLNNLIGLMASIPPALAQSVKPEIPVFIRVVGNDAELSIHYSPLMPLIRVRTSKDLVNKVSGISFIGVVLDSGGTVLKMYKNRDEMGRDREKLLLVFRVFMNSDIELQPLPSVSRGQGGVII